MNRLHKNTTTRRTCRTFAVSLLAAAAVVAPASAAYAGSDESITVNGGQATFQAYGEILTATDTRVDGRCVTAYLKYIGAGPNSPVVYKHATACGRGDVARNNLSIAEGDPVWLQVCYTGGGADDTCSKWQGATA